MHTGMNGEYAYNLVERRPEILQEEWDEWDEGDALGVLYICVTSSDQRKIDIS